MTLYNILKWILLAFEVGIFIYLLLVVRKMHKAANELEDLVEEGKAEQERVELELTTTTPEEPEETPTMEIKVRRDGKDIVSFDVHPLSDKAFDLASEAAQSATGFDADKYNTTLIYLAATREHKLLAMASIVKLLTSGEIEAIVEAITKFTEAEMENSPDA